MRLQISDMPSCFSRYARPTGKPHIAQGLTHGPAASAVARGVDVRLSHVTHIGSAAEEMTEMSFLIAPRRDFDGAPLGRIGIDDAGGLEGIDHAKRPIEPARVILALEMRPGQPLWPGLCADAEDVADAVDRGR